MKPGQTWDCPVLKIVDPTRYFGMKGVVLCIGQDKPDLPTALIVQITVSIKDLDSRWGCETANAFKDIKPIKIFHTGCKKIACQCMYKKF